MMPDQMPYWNEIAERAYTAYGQITDFKNYQGNPMPKYDELPDAIKKAWRAAAQEVVKITKNY